MDHGTCVIRSPLAKLASTTISSNSSASKLDMEVRDKTLLLSSPGIRRSSTLDLLKSRLASLTVYPQYPTHLGIAALDDERASPRRVSATLSCSVDHTQLMQIKTQILLKNPAVFQRVQERIVESHHRSHYGAVLVWHDFLKNDMKRVDLRDEILQKCVDTDHNDVPLRIGRGRLLAYLKGEASLTNAIQAVTTEATSRSISPMRIKGDRVKIKEPDDHSMESIPSRDSTEGSYDEDEKSCSSCPESLL